MAKRGVRVIVLCEDQQHQVFIRSMLLRLGFHAREIRFRPLTPGRGAAEHRVRTEYPNEVAAFRRQVAHQKVGLLVMIDADTGTADDRKSQLAASLRDASVDPRSTGEAIAILVPRRNVETWVAWLCGEPVTEESDPKRAVSPNDVRRAADQLAELVQGRTVCPPSLLPSLRDATEELRRLLA